MTSKAPTLRADFDWLCPWCGRMPRAVLPVEGLSMCRAGHVSTIDEAHKRLMPGGTWPSWPDAQPPR